MDEFDTHVIKWGARVFGIRFLCRGTIFYRSWLPRSVLRAFRRAMLLFDELTMKRYHHFLDYMATHLNEKIRYYASDMVLNVHSDASYLSAPNARSQAAGYYFLGSVPKNCQPIK